MDSSAQQSPTSGKQAIPAVKARPVNAILILIAGTALLILAMGAAIAFGPRNISFAEVWRSLIAFNPAITDHQIIYELRLPRTIAAALVGASFAVSGAIMQGISRNPMADPGILGINAGATLMLAVSFAFFPAQSYQGIMLFCFAGAAMSTALVFGIGSAVRGGLSPVRLVLAGSAISALFLAVSQGLALHYRVGQEMAFWFAGGVAGTRWIQVQIALPWIIAGLLAAFVLARSITVLSLGEEIAAGLGQRTGLIRLASLVIVFMLSGGSVSLVGPVAFVGLVIPHLTRSLVGVDYRWVIPCTAVLGAILVVAGDFGARMINPPREVPLGALIAMIGVPFFLYVARKERREF
ncbi:ferrichrome ABC transporter permease [Paenibacillus sambharensis]|uniref:Ferrichrome ABC transporter permease n=1 Tax=Paenibacillus sambharensis TaxID=1803190 RepID=A0A2W1L9W2_9BACL|nr:iron ABC transporter permease [Paenibacillus sambharensis]PZD94920.1 ferrichrome ABC transporter permease [Paenibacillus sambharensis]